MNIKCYGNRPSRFIVVAMEDGAIITMRQRGAHLVQKSGPVATPETYRRIRLSVAAGTIGPAPGRSAFAKTMRLALSFSGSVYGFAEQMRVVRERVEAAGERVNAERHYRARVVYRNRTHGFLRVEVTDVGTGLVYPWSVIHDEVEYLGPATVTQDQLKSMARLVRVLIGVVR